MYMYVGNLESIRYEHSKQELRRLVTHTHTHTHTHKVITIIVVCIRRALMEYQKSYRVRVVRMATYVGQGLPVLFIPVLPFV